MVVDKPEADRPAASENELEEAVNNVAAALYRELRNMEPVFVNGRLNPGDTILIDGRVDLYSLAEAAVYACRSLNDA